MLLEECHNFSANSFCSLGLKYLDYVNNFLLSFVNDASVIFWALTEFNPLVSG